MPKSKLKKPSYPGMVIKLLIGPPMPLRKGALHNPLIPIEKAVCFLKTEEGRIFPWPAIKTQRDIEDASTLLAMIFHNVTAIYMDKNDMKTFRASCKHKVRVKV